MLMPFWIALVCLGLFYLPRFLGPLFTYDLNKTARTSHIVLVRSLFAGFLGTIFLLAYASWSEEYEFSSPARVGRFTESFFWALAAIEYFLLLLLTPAYVAGVLAEERERGALEVLFTTDLRSREIVLGLFASRLAKIAMVLAAGLPIFCVLQFLGGIDPALILFSGLALALTLFGLGGLSMLNSIRYHKPLQASMSTYLMAGGYLILSSLSTLLLSPRLGLATWPSTPSWQSPVEVENVVEWFNSGNLITLALNLFTGVAAGARLDALLFAGLKFYAPFQVVLGGGCCALSILVLRARALRSGEDCILAFERPGRRLLSWFLKEQPMLSKELLSHAKARRRLGVLLAGCGLALLFLPAFHVCWFLGRLFAADGSPLGDLISYWARTITAALGLVLLVRVAVRASGAVIQERNRQTLDGLLLTRLSTRSILFSKWLASWCADGRWWFCLFLVWSFAFAVGVLHPLGIVAFLITWLAVATFLASVGIWFSTRENRFGYAILGTILLGLAGLFIGFLAGFRFVDPGVVTENEARAFFPPGNFFALLFSPEQLRLWHESKDGYRFWTMPVLASVWYVASAVIFWQACRRFRIVTGRTDGSDSGAAVEPIVPEAISRDTNSGWLDFWRQHVPSPGQCLRAVAPTLLFLSPLLLLAAGYGLMAYEDRRAVQQVIAELDETGTGWRTDELEAARAVVPQEENSALPVLEIFGELFGEFNFDEVPGVLANANQVSPPFRLSTEERKELNRLLSPVEPIVSRAMLLKNFATGRFRYWDSGGGGRGWPDPRRAASYVAILLNLAALRLLDDGKVDEALRCSSSMLSAADSLGDSSNLEDLTLRQDIQANAFRVIICSLAQGPASESILEALQKRIADEDRVPYALMAVRSARALSHETLKSFEWTLAYSMAEEKRRKGGIPSLFPVQPFTQNVFCSLKSLPRQYARILRIQTAMMNAVKLRRLEQTKAFITIFYAFDQSTWIEQNVVALPFLPEFEFRAAERRCMLAALALERYRLAKGDWPKALNDLVPDYHEKQPLDPYTDVPLRYAVLGDGVMVYSVGPDGQDDGGKIGQMPDPGSQLARPSGWDIGFRLWNPAFRRQPAVKGDKDK